jgi:hypothetical protein
MSRREQHSWDRERVQPDSSEWPSTLIGSSYECRRPAAAIKRNLKREVRAGNVIVALVIFAVLGGLGVHVLAHLFRG